MTAAKVAPVLAQQSWVVSNTLRGLILALLTQAVVMLGLTDVVDVDKVVEYGLALVTMLANAYAFWWRARGANPPVTDAAVEATATMVRNQESKS